MNVDMPEEYRQFGDAVAGWLTQHAGPASLRRLWEGHETPEDLHRWASLARLGVGALTLDSSRDGSGSPLWSAMPVIEACGKAALPEPVSLLVSTVLPVLSRMKDLPPDLDDVLSRLADGTSLASIQDGWDGVAPWASASEIVLVFEVDTVSICRVTADNVESIDGIDRSRRVGRVGRDSIIMSLDSEAAVRDLWARARVGTAATLTGLADEALSRTVAYAKIRKQFARPIGSFQMVQQMLTDAYSLWEFTHRYVWYAAWVVDNIPELADEVSRRAKALAGEFAEKSSYAALQVHGAIGYTWEYDLHFWLRRLQVEASHFGTAADHWRWLAENSDFTAGELVFAT